MLFRLSLIFMFLSSDVSLAEVGGRACEPLRPLPYSVEEFEDWHSKYRPEVEMVYLSCNMPRRSKYNLQDAASLTTLLNVCVEYREYFLPTYAARKDRYCQLLEEYDNQTELMFRRAIGNEPIYVSRKNFYRINFSNNCDDSVNFRSRQPGMFSAFNYFMIKAGECENFALQTRRACRAANSC